MSILKNLWTCVLLLIISQETFSQEHKSSSEFIKSIEGVYKARFTGQFASGQKYETEDILEIVSYSPSSIYFRAELKFGNGHFCSVYGIANYNNNSFVYEREFGEEPKHKCVLNINVDSNSIKISDLNEKNESTCTQYYCGARGYLGKYEISLEKKRKIRYMPIILKSKEYAAAEKEYKSK
ncbi:hypothetical protein [Cellvibrio sp. pealriver]|uniref:hypothetical protein n=1 Tax=Cellvibrio sp. pealriver TaxID=1622269 RepID=UPI00066FCEBE|nr:hypothetical protein [Cellvibrio sp. pealriver]